MLKAKRETQLKRLKQEYGTTRWRAKRKVDIMTFDPLLSIIKSLPMNLSA